MGEKIYALDFEILGKLPQELFTKFTAAQAKLLGLRGWIQNTAEGTYKGYFEGKMPNMEKIKETIEKAENFKPLMSKVNFGKVKEIPKYTAEKFEVKT